MEEIPVDSKGLIMKYETLGDLWIQCTHPTHSKSLIDKIDGALAERFAIPSEQLHFLIDAGIKYHINGSKQGAR